jgi:hypothetical protein
MGLVRRVAAAVLLALTVLTMTAVRPAAADTAGDEAAFVNSLNALRTAKGLQALTVHAGLTDVARAWAGRMSAAGTISHNGDLSSQGPSEWQRLGENVGMGMEVQGIHDAFVNSPGHYKNMVDGGFNSVGIGVVRNAENVIFVTVNFMQAPVAAAAAPAPAPAPTPAPAPAPAPAPKPVPVAVPAPAPAPAPVPVAAAVAAAVPAAVPAAPIETATPALPVAAPVEPLAATAEQPVLTTRRASSVRQAGFSVSQFQVILIGTAMFLAGALALGRRPVRRPVLAYR